jgi:hypothetical protein
MSHEHDGPTAGTASAPDEPHAPPTATGAAMLARARRVLTGDVRPDDHLPVTPEVRAAAEFEMGYVRSHMKVEPLPEVVAHQLRGWLLSFHHGGENILFVEDDKGVIVLAAGLEQIGALVRDIPDELQHGLIDHCPEPF